MDELQSVTMVGAPAVIAAVIGVFRANILARLTTDWLPPIAFLGGLAWGVAAWQSDLFYAPGAFTAVMIGVNIGLAAVGAWELSGHYSGRTRPPR